MPFRQGRITTIPGKGTINPDKKTFQGKGKAPAGYHKIPEATIDNSPVVTIDQGRVTTSGFRSKKAARAARKAAERRQLKTLRLLSSKPQKSSQGATKPSKPKAPPPPKLAPPPKLSAKPKTFAGAPTAGEPTLLELKTAKARGRLGQNAKGYVTTPAVRKVAKTVHRLEHKAKASHVPLPGLGPSESRNARVVLSKGRKAGATHKEMLAAAETGLVESGFRNLPTSRSDGTSAGWRQATEQVRYGPESRRRRPGPTAEDFFSETASAGRGRGQTAGQLAQTVQGSAYPERYDQRSGEAKALLSAYERGQLPPAQARKLAKAQAEAQKLGLKGAVPKPKKSGRVPSVVYIGRQAEKKFGLNVGENPAFGGVAPVHVEDSYHYRTDAKGRGEAIDVSGAPEKMMAFDQWVAKKWGKGVTELFYDPGISIKEGQVIGSIGGHEDHVHVAVAQPGEKFFGGISGGAVAGSGGAVMVGYGASASAALASARKAGRAASEGKGRSTSPFKRYWGTLRKLRSADLAKAPTEPKGASSLAELERKYGSPAV